MANYTYSEAVEQTITAGEQIHQIVNGTATTEVTVEDGSKVPSIRKALLDNFYFKDPIAWQVGQTENVFNQLRQFTDGSWWYAPSATASNHVSMGSTPVGDTLWKIYDFDAIGKLTPQIREALRRSYAEAGYNLVGSFGTVVTVNTAADVVLWEPTGVAYAWTGNLPHTIGAGETPIGNPLWVSVALKSLRADIQVADYAALRAYTGSLRAVYVTGTIATARPEGIAGSFVLDSTDTTSADNDATIIVGTDGRRWKRVYVNTVSPCWFGAKFNGINDDTTAIQAAINYCASLFTGSVFFSTPTDTFKTVMGTTLELPSGTAKVTNTLTVPVVYTSGTTKYSCVSIVGQGQSSSVLDFSGAPANTDGLVVLGGASEQRDFQILRPRRDGLVIGTSTGFSWYHTVKRVFVNGAGRHGQLVYSMFRSKWDDNLSAHCGGWGFAFTQGMTSTVIQNNYSNTCALGGYLLGDLVSLGASSSCVYSSLISNACDNGVNAYVIAGAKGFTMIGNGSEKATDYSILLSACDITIDGHFSDRTGKNDIFIEGNGRKNIKINGLVPSRPIDPSIPAIQLHGDSKVSINGPVPERTYLTSGTSTSTELTVEDKVIRVLKTLNGQTAAPLVLLKHPSGYNATYGGELLVRAVFGSAISPSTVQNTMLYRLMVLVGAGGTIVVTKDTVSTPGSDINLDTMPSFVFSISGNALHAKHLNPAGVDRSYTFSIHSQGEIICAPYI